MGGRWVKCQRGALERLSVVGKSQSCDGSSCHSIRLTILFFHESHQPVAGTHFPRTGRRLSARRRAAERRPRIGVLLISKPVKKKENHCGIWLHSYFVQGGETHLNIKSELWCRNFLHLFFFFGGGVPLRVGVLFLVRRVPTPGLFLKITRRPRWRRIRSVAPPHSLSLSISFCCTEFYPFIVTSTCLSWFLVSFFSLPFDLTDFTEFYRVFLGYSPIYWVFPLFSYVFSEFGRFSEFLSGYKFSE